MTSCNQQYTVHTTELGELHEARTPQSIATDCKMDSQASTIRRNILIFEKS